MGVLSAVALPQFIDFSKEAKTNVTAQKLADFKVAIVGDPHAIANGVYTQPGFLGNMGVVPTALTELTTQGALPAYDPFNRTGWRGPYVSTSDTNWNRDAWLTLIQYNSGTRTLTSCGPDKVCANGDDIIVQF